MIISIVTVVKPDQSVRICIHPTYLNEAIEREHNPMKTIDEVVADMQEATVFSTLDSTSGFWQLKLYEESSKLTPLYIPFGRYRFLRAPFGIKSIPEINQSTMSEMIEDLELLVYGKDMAKHDRTRRALLERAEEWNLKLSTTNCQLRKDTVKYVGHQISKDGLKADPENVRVIRDICTPTYVKKLQTLFRLIT